MSIALLERPEEAPPEPAHTSFRRLHAVRGERRLREVMPLIVDDGCDVRLGRGEVEDAVRVALLEWLPLRRDDLALFDRGLLRASPAVALAYLVRPPTVWTLEEAVAAARLHDRSAGGASARLLALQRDARDRVGGVHLDRLRSAVARIAEQVPLVGLPRASAVVAAGCAAVVADDETCASVASTLLVRYGLSATAVRAGGLHLP